MLDRIRSVLVVLEEGSINRASTRLGVSQPTLTRQLQLIESEVGAELFERGPWGVRGTDLAYRLRERMLPVLRDYDLAWAEITAHARGRRSQLRVGYLGLSAARFLTPVLGRFREAHPETRLCLFDQTPQEQLEALRAGNLDLALIGQEGAGLGNEFYRHRIARIGIRAALPSDHPLATHRTIALSRLKGEGFIVPSETAVPGRRQWVARLCHKAGFRPRWLAQTDAVAETFARVTGERGISLLPDYLEPTPPPGVVLVPLSDRFATWEFALLRQRGRLTPACRDLIHWIGEVLPKGSTEGSPPGVE
ncbi:MAG: LysR family transcriptional regulator [Verrucomicrobiae bacterium]|nr:LysR family transcriptional regulator [Verrucomicrobiae bacterium]